MHRDRHHPRIVGEGRFDAIAVVGVEVDIEHPCLAVVEQGQDRKDRIVEEAKAIGAVRHPVMRPARRMKGHAAFERGFGGKDRAADRGRGALVKPLKYRIFHRADIIGLACLGADAAGRFSVAQGGDIVGHVKPRDRLEAGLRALQIGRVFGEPAQHFAQRHHGADPRNRQWMVPAIP